MLKLIKLKYDSNLSYSPPNSDLIKELGNYKTLLEALLNLAESCDILEAMSLLRRKNQHMYLKQKSKIEKALIEIYKDKDLENQRKYIRKDFYILNKLCNYILNKLYKALNKYLEKGKKKKI